MKCIILTFLSEDLRRVHEDIVSAVEIMEHLEEMFSHQNPMTNQFTKHDSVKLEMVEGTPVREHVLEIMAYLNKLEVLGADFD